MKVETWLEVSELFCAAIELPSDARAAFLTERAAASEVRAEVERLLALHERAGDSLDGPGAFLPRFSLAEGDRVGHYTLLRVLGSGGMGTVFEALQDRPQRKVALKTLRLGFSSPARLQRFLLEAEVLGRLRHPGIAQIHEAGTHEEGGQLFPWFAMELVAGARDVLAYAAARGLALDARVRLFLDVCDAVQHGHQKGVIHRDLKAGNILVDAEGRVKVIDFGVARAMDGGVLTGPGTLAGQLVGTLATMSPEQLAGDPDAIDARSDVYSLGVVLYELVAGQPPYALEGLALEDALRRIREMKPVRAPGMPRELHWILLRALAKDSERRYASVSELAADLRRFSADEPVSAGPPSRLYLARKFVARHRLAVFASSAVALALVGGIVSTSWQASLARAGRRAAETQSEIARAVAGFLDELLRSPDPELARGKEVTARELLDAASTKVDGAFPDRPEVEAAVRTTIGLSYESLGLFDPAERHLRRAHELVRRTLGEDHEDSLAASIDLARVLTNGRHLDEAVALARTTFEGYRRKRGDDDELTLRARVLLALAAKAHGAFDEAERLLVEGVARIRAKPRSDPQLLGDYLHNLASTYFDQGRYAEAEGYYREVLDCCGGAPGDESPDTLTMISSLATVLVEEGKFAEAEPLFDRAVEGSLRILGKEHPWTTWRTTRRADLYLAERKYARAENDYRAAVESLGDGDWAAITPLNGLATSLEFQGRPAEAIEASRASLALCREHFGDDHPDTWMIEANLAAILRVLDELDEAVELLEPAQRRLAERLGAAHPQTLATTLELGRLMHDLGLDDEARALFEQVVEAGETAEGPLARSYVIGAGEELARL